MALTMISTEAFLDPESLLCVTFQNLDEDPKAAIVFKSGQDLTLQGQSAVALHSLLSPVSQDQDKTCNSHRSSDVPEEGWGAGENAPLHSDTWEDKEYKVPHVSSGFVTTPLRRNKAWYFKAEGSKKAFMAFVNAKGSCSLRMFDAKTGVAFPKEYRAGDYQEQFRDLLEGATLLYVRSQPNLERDCKDRLPQSTFEILREQILSA